MSLCRLSAVNRFPIQLYRVFYFTFLVNWDSWVQESENRIPLKQVVGVWKNTNEPSLQFSNFLGYLYFERTHV